MTTGVVPTGGAQVVAAMRALVEQTTALQQARLGGLSDKDVEECLRLGEQARRRLAGFERGLVADVTRRGIAPAHSCTSVATYLRDLLRVSLSEANRRVRETAWLAPRFSLLGEELPATYPILAAAADEGAVSAEHVEVIARSLDRLPKSVSPANLDDAERYLTEHARTLLPAGTAEVAVGVENHLDPDERLTGEREQREKATVSLSKGLHGRWRLSGVLDPESGAIVKTALDALSKPVPGPDGERDPRDAGKRHADAMVQIATWSLDSGGMPANGGRKPQLVLTTTVENLRQGTGLARTQWGDLVTAETLAKHACDAEIALARLDRYGAVLNLGRTARLISPDQRRALNLRDKGCVFPGCDRPPAWCQGHHILDWTKGGYTDSTISACCARSTTPRCTRRAGRSSCSTADRISSHRSGSIRTRNPDSTPRTDRHSWSSSRSRQGRAANARRPGAARGRGGRGARVRTEVDRHRPGRVGGGPEG